MSYEKMEIILKIMFVLLHLYMHTVDALLW